MMKDEAEESISQSANVDASIPSVPAGLGEEESRARLTEFMKSRGSFGEAVQTGLLGAGMGSQAAQGATNPLAAFIQGAAVGMQAPAQMYEQKRKQIQSVYDATPFKVTHPEIADKEPYDSLAGFPTALALKIIEGIAVDTAKIKATSTARAEEIGLQGKQDRATKLFEASLKGKDPAKYEDISAMSKDFRTLDEVQQYKLAKASSEMIKQAPDDGAGDLMIMANYAKILNPQTRFSESNLDATDISSSIDKYTKGLFDKVISGRRLQQDEINKIKAAALKAFYIRRKEYQDVASVWEEKATELGIDPDFVVSDKGWESKYIGGKLVMARQLPNGKWEVRP